MNSMLKAITIITLVASILVMTACSSGGDEETPAFIPTNNDESVQYHPFDVNQFKLNEVVCDPFSGPGNPGMNDGLIAELFYLDHKLHRHSGVQDFFDKGTASKQKLFFTSIAVPTRVFDTGFPSESGSVIQNDSGEDLFEYFGLRFKSVLSLGADDEEGDYELALLSDDGAIMKVINIDGTEQVLVDNDGIHPSRFGCGETVKMERDTALDIRLEYFQGPRHHISLIPTWRKVDSHTQKEKECGKQGNGRYFKFNHNSEPQKQYHDLLARGWKPIAPENWSLPLSTIFNPCQHGTPAIVRDFAIEKQAGDVVIATWTTDRPATSQVLYRDSRGQDWMTNSDNILRTSHRIVVDRMATGDTYIFQGVAITLDMGKTLSQALQIAL